MKNYCLLALALTLTVPASAGSSDFDFASSLNDAGGSLIGRARALKADPRFSLLTQQTGPNDPILLTQKPLLDMIKKVEPSVVLLRMTLPNAENPSKPAHATCTGFFTAALKELGRPSIITTNSHCVEELPVGAEIEIGLYDGNANVPKMTKGKVLAYGSSKAAKDIAFVELLDPKLNRRGLPTWTKLDCGESVIAIGNPLGLSFSISKGVVSALGRDHLDDEFILDSNQSDVAVNPGNSGGPLFNMWGSVVGINSMILSQSGGFEGISLSLPAGYITLAMKQYKRTGNLEPGVMQVEISASTETKTLKVNKVGAGGPAAAADMRTDDQVLKVDALDLALMDPAAAMKAFLVYVKYRSPGEVVAVTVKRDGVNVVLPVTIGKAKPPRPEWAPIPNKKTSLVASVEL